MISVIQRCQIRQYEPVEEDLSFHLHERQMSPQDSPNYKGNQTTHNYKPLVYNPSAVMASTSRQEPAAYIEDVQPCTSKSSEPYRLA